MFLGAESTPRVTTNTTAATIDGLHCGTAYTIAVQALDGAGNRSTKTSGQLSTAVCPLRVQMLSARVVRTKAVRGLVVKLRSSVATKGSRTVFVNNKQIARTGVVLRAGTNVLSIPMPRASGRQRVRLVLRLVDPKGGAKTLTYRMTVRI